MSHGQLWVGKGDVVLSAKGLGTNQGPHGLVNQTKGIYGKAHSWVQVPTADTSG